MAHANGLRMAFTSAYAHFCTAHPSSFDTGRAWKPKGLSLRHCLRSSARRPLATPDMPALLVEWAHFWLCSPCFLVPLWSYAWLRSPEAFLGTQHSKAWGSGQISTLDSTAL